jgi:circadian clock protein KaiC
MAHIATIDRPMQAPDDRVSTGCAGLDDVLGGGLPRGHLYLLEGDPGAGKTTLALGFLLEGVRRGERVLDVTLSESRADLENMARSHGFFLDQIEFFELLPGEEDLNPGEQYSVFHPADVELSDRMQTIIAEIERVKPDRLVVDSLSELRMLAKDSFRYRRQILALKEYLNHRGCTAILLDDLTSHERDLQLHSIAHGVIALEKLLREYGTTRRRMEIRKLRGVKFREGFHDYSINTGGVMIYPRLVAAEFREETASGVMPSGITELDELVGGGLDLGTSTLILGPAGAGKTTLSVRWALSAAQRGEQAAIYLFEETSHTLLARARGLGMDLAPYIKSGLITLQRLTLRKCLRGNSFSRCGSSSVKKTQKLS